LLRSFSLQSVGFTASIFFCLPASSCLFFFPLSSASRPGVFSCLLSPFFFRKFSLGGWTSLPATARARARTHFTRPPILHLNNTISRPSALTTFQPEKRPDSRARPQTRTGPYAHIFTFFTRAGSADPSTQQLSAPFIFPPHRRFSLFRILLPPHNLSFPPTPLYSPTPTALTLLTALLLPVQTLSHSTTEQFPTYLNPVPYQFVLPLSRSPFLD